MRVVWQDSQNKKNLGPVAVKRERDLGLLTYMGRCQARFLRAVQIYDLLVIQSSSFAPADHLGGLVLYCVSNVVQAQV